MDAAKHQLLTNRSRLHELSGRCGVPIAADADPAEGVLQDFTAAMESWDQQAAQGRQGEDRRQGKAA